MSINGHRQKCQTKPIPYLEEGCKDHGTGVAKLKGGEQLGQDLVFAEVLWEGVQVVAQVLEELLLLGRLLNLKI